MTYKYGIGAIAPKGYELTKARSERLGIIVENIRTSYERATAYNFKRTFRQLRKGLEQYEEITDKDLNFEFAKCREAQEKVLSTIYGKIAEETRPLIIEDGATKKATEEDKVWLAMIEAWIRDNIGQHIKYIDETTRADIRKIFLSTSTTAEFRAAIDPYFRVSTPARSYVIARTECAHATNATMTETMRTVDTGRDKITIWNAWRDERTRQSHLQMAGKTVPYGELFRVTNIYGGIDLLEYPTDSSHGATPGNVIQCRCFQSWKYV